MQGEYKLETSSFENVMQFKCMLVGKKGIVAHAKSALVPTF
jgi:hypothetical protein